MNSQTRTAIVVGATGLVGSYLVEELLKRQEYSKIIVLVRRLIDIKHEKLKQHIVDFNDPEKFSSLLLGDDIYCALGTTIRKAGSQENFKKIDLDLPVKIGSLAVKNGIHNFLVVSSIGANAGSRNFYLRTKGKMEKKIMQLGFEHVYIVRPSMLLGKRKEFRFGEIAGKVMIRIFSFLLLGKLRKYRGIHGKTVAKSMIRLALSCPSKIIVESDELHSLGSYT